MNVFSQLIDGLGYVLRFFHDLFEGVVGLNSWGWAIVFLTITVRIVLLPLAIKQINSMRGMQRLQPEMKKVQEKYKTDRDMMRKNPEKYRERRQKQQEEMMALYKEHGVNPAAGCLPLLLQMPIFFALFRLLQDGSRIDLSGAPFYLVNDLAEVASQGGIGAFALIALMGATTFLSQKQMMASNPASAQNQQQKILLYVMPVMLLVFAFNMPIGVLLYWVTTNLWTMVQQFIMFRNIEPGAKANAA